MKEAGISTYLFPMLEIFERFERTMEDYESQGKSFIVETTTPGLTYTQKAQQLRKAGWKIGVIALGVATPGLAMERVAARTRKGGHYLDDVSIQNRWEACLVQTPDFLRSADRAEIYDNSTSKPIKIAVKESVGAAFIPCVDANVIESNPYMRQLMEGIHNPLIRGKRTHRSIF